MASAKFRLRAGGGRSRRFRGTKLMVEGWKEAKFRRPFGGARGSEQVRGVRRGRGKRGERTVQCPKFNRAKERAADAVRERVGPRRFQSRPSQYGVPADFQLSDVEPLLLRNAYQRRFESETCRGTGTGEEISGRAGERGEAGNEGGGVGSVRWGKGLGALQCGWFREWRPYRMLRRDCARCPEGPPATARCVNVVFSFRNFSTRGEC